MFYPLLLEKVIFTMLSSYALIGVGCALTAICDVFLQPWPKTLTAWGVSLADLWAFDLAMESLPWDDSAIDSNLFEPNWRTMKVGTVVDVVVQVHCFGGDMSRATVVPSGCPCLVSGVLPCHAGPGRYTLFGAIVASTGPLTLQMDFASRVRVHTLPCAASIPALVEICAGLGGSSFGLEFAGFKLLAAVEWMPKLAELHSSMRPNIPVIVGDIGQSLTLRQLNDVCIGPFSVMAGVSCQPYSRAGSQGGSADPRSNTIPATCRLCHLFQVPILVLECVVPAKSNLYVRQHLNALKHLGYRILECVLQLEQIWTANRQRWWVVACHPQLGIVDLPVFPPRPQMVVRDLMPYVREWPSDDLAQLMLAPSEHQEFSKHSNDNLRQFSVNFDAKLPTALHSWGNQVVSCACGCRDRLSSSLLRERGLFAQLLPMKSDEDGKPPWRHLHPAEVAMLNGLPPLQGWSTNQRLNLCGIGQIASPLQAVWIGANILRQIQLTLGIAQPICPNQVLQQLQTLVRQQSQTLYPSLPKPLPALTCQVSWISSTSPVVIHVSESTTVGSLRLAEAQLQNVDGSHWTFVDATTGETLPDDAPVAGRCLQVDPKSTPAPTCCVARP